MTLGAGQLSSQTIGILQCGRASRQGRGSLVYVGGPGLLALFPLKPFLSGKRGAATAALALRDRGSSTAPWATASRQADPRASPSSVEGNLIKRGAVARGPGRERPFNAAAAGPGPGPAPAPAPAGGKAPPLP